MEGNRKYPKVRMPKLLNKAIGELANRTDATVAVLESNTPKLPAIIKVDITKSTAE
jgi:hypothetical protein